ncbi:hypothetical protein OIU85_025541 [Salix viminalis]|uniref:Uncharacterized protein n=1 Tax=Salix viminalis TaxID=40686 RepID=A0A9Q0TLU8_SALVM|nr:hypothetical protein OIU85_025541 [Salix viminalis]
MELNFGKNNNFWCRKCQQLLNLLLFRSTFMKQTSHPLQGFTLSILESFFVQAEYTLSVFCKILYCDQIDCQVSRIELELKRLQEQFAAEQDELSCFKLVSAKEASLGLMSTSAGTMVGTPTARHGGALFGRHAISAGRKGTQRAGFLM